MNDDFWRSVAAALKDHPPAPDDAVGAMLRRAALDTMPVASRTGHVRFAARLVLAQVRLVRWSVWVASALVMGLGVLVAGVGDGGPATVLAMVAPLVAAAGIAGACGPEPELVAATATSPRVVLVARVTLVFGYNLVLALASSTVLGGIGPLIGAWLGPMALLSSACLLLSVWLGPSVGIAAAVALWVIRVLGPGLGVRHVEVLWSSNLLTGAVAVVLAGAAVVVAGRFVPRLAAGEGT